MLGLDRPPRSAERAPRTPGVFSAGHARARAASSESSHPETGICAHCEGPTASPSQTFCCPGCEHVHELIRGQGLARYYELREGKGVPGLEAARGLVDDTWIDLAIARLAGAEGLVRLDLDVEGLHCTGCVWLIEEVFRRTGAEGRVTTNPALGTIELFVGRAFPLRDYSQKLLALGYRLGPHRKSGDRRSDDLVWRIGVCVAIAMNAMIFAIARYAGLEGGALERVFLYLETGLALAAFSVGGIVFVRTAWRGLVGHIVSLDLPIAVGLILGYAGSVVAVLEGNGGGSYFDTLIVFTTLMLVGRFLRERVLEQNRAQLLEDAGIEGLHCRRVEDGRVRVVPVASIAIGDRLLVAPSDVVPVAAVAVDGGTFGFDWVTGESDARTFPAGSTVEAGAANAGSSAVELTAIEPFSTSRLVRLLRSTTPGGDSASKSAFEGTIASFWVPSVLVAAAGGFVLHLLLGATASAALSVSVAILVVTCPCAFGIATPLANELVLSGLRKRGLLVRSADFLERATSVRRIVFDKTGTLTNGQLRIEDSNQLDFLSPSVLRVLYNLACRSSHPKAAAVKAAVPTACHQFEPGLVVTETPGIGVEAHVDGSRFSLGACPEGIGGDVALARDGVVLASLTTAEELRADAREEIQGLTADGFEIWMATGDIPARATAVAQACEIEDAHVRAAQSPEDKARLIAELDRHDTLMIGDGVNDGPAVQRAHCSGTPAAGRAFLASRADFYLLAAGLGPVRKGLTVARALRRTLRGNLRWAVTYNVIALSLSYAGWMTPLLCAVLMPVSSLVSIALVIRALGQRGAVWRS
ncbi:MAG: HAD-IC family P-type ATPase [Polyangiaceae bacterium]|nr:HAD-IC family P-type ATPase [Polyangiaceae bacterium]